MITPGAFVGVAVSGPSLLDDVPVLASSYALPAGLFVHWGHGWATDDPDARPVGVAVPTLVGEQVHVHAVLASGARAAWNALVLGRLDRLSIVCDRAALDHAPVALNFTSTPAGIVAAGLPLLAVDLVGMGADEEAGVTDVIPHELMSDAERETQRRLDLFLDDPEFPSMVELAAHALDVGVAALEPLRSLVEPLLAAEMTA